jgi:hypothetical protein
VGSEFPPAFISRAYTIPGDGWLLAVYTKTLHLRVHFNITRTITHVGVDGQILKASHIVMAPTYIAHRLDPSWNSENYPAVREFGL